MSIFGGLAAASLGGTAIAQAASRKPEIAPAVPATDEIDPASKTALDSTEAEFSQYVGRHRPHRPFVPRHRRPVIVRRPVVVRRRVIVRRPHRVIRRRPIYVR
ncbi:hypothetical protein [Bosea psychrotolerans]|nr:hypothetical protein [Bosea psychrotolerans]